MEDLTNPSAFDSEDSASGIEEIIGPSPNILVRCGSGAALLALLLIVAISAFIKYPSVRRLDIIVFIECNENRQFVAKGFLLQDVRYLAESDISDTANTITGRSIKQSMNIKLDKYPFEKYGVLLGEIDSLSTTPETNGCRIRVRLPQGASTTLNLKLPLYEPLRGVVERSNHNRTIAQRIFQPLWDGIKY